VRVTEATTPVPLSVADMVGAVPDMVKLPGMAPAAVGAKPTVIVQVPLRGIAAVQVFAVTLYTVGVVVGGDTDRGTLPVFVTVNTWLAELPTRTLP
jgi:hypothetical protein